MKRLNFARMAVLCLALIIAVLPSLAVSGLAEVGDGYIGDMQVVNCKSWISLRKSASTSSARLVRVPLGAEVKDCSWYNNDFIYGEYDGYRGYMQAKYLTEEVHGSYDYIGDMQVVNCKSWISLRKSASTSSARLVRVPLGAEVKNCSWYDSDFIYGEYNGQRGYILARYLSEEIHGTDGYIGNMQIVNCDSWVSLRKSASTSSACLVRVPLGAEVRDCSWYNSDFIYGKYNGQRGYILAKYLSEEVYGSHDYIGNMQVVNCKSWVSLRKSPSTSSLRLIKIPLGAKVQNCKWYDGQFIYCEYNGYQGYVLAEFLA